MKRIFLGLIAIIFLAITGGIAVAVLTPKEVYKEKIETAAADALGREIKLNGDVGLSFFPRIAASVENVTVANAEGFDDEYMIQAGALRAAVKWGPLFTRRVEVHEIAFIDADVRLATLADGRANWEFETGTQEPSDETPQTGDLNAGVDRARLVNASLSYKDGVAGTSYALTDVNIEASIASLTEELKANGSGVFEGDAFNFDLALDSPQAIIDGISAAANITFNADLITASFDGTFTLTDIPSLSGDFSVTAPDIKSLADYAEIDPATLPITLGPLGSITARGKASGTLENLILDIASLTVDGEALEINYEGQATYSETPSADGRVTVELNDAENTISALGLDIPEAAILRGAKLTASAQVNGPADAIKASNVDLRINGALLDLTYKGDAATGTTTSVNGKLNVTSSDVYALIKASGVELEPSQTDPLKGASLNLRTSLSGPAETISASAIDLALDGPLLKAAYKGDVSLQGEGSLNGTLTASSDSLRALMAAADVELTPGTTLQTFRVSGNASGAFNRLAINGLDLAVDDVTGQGDLIVRTDTARPSITGTLATGPLDLTPFMGEAAEDEAPAGWSKEPLALESLKSIDTDITLSSPLIIVDNIKISDAKLKAKLTNGVLDTNINQFKVFGGLWKGDIDLNTSRSVPTLSIAMTGDSILMQDIMETFIGNDMLTGGGQFKLDITARGNTLHDIVNSLNGDLGANLSEGAIKGVNIGQLIRTATDLRANLSSPANLISNLAVSPSAQSDFSSFNSLLKIENGVAQIELMEILSSTFGANGLGQINLGGQTLDMALRIAADTNARGELKDVQLNNVGIPLRITGPWTSPRIVPDTSALTQLLAGQALDRFGNIIGGGAGNNDVTNAVTSVLGNVIGNNTGARPVPPPINQSPNGQPPANGQPEDKTPEKKPETVEEAVEDVVEDLAKDALGGLFGRRKKD